MWDLFWANHSQAADQTADFISDLRSPAAWSGPPTPVKPKAAAMQADDGLWFHDDAGIGPAGPDTSSAGHIDVFSGH